MRRPGGWAAWTMHDKIVREHDTTTCGHCSKVVTVEPRMRPEQQTTFRVIELETCRMCMRHICPGCVYEAQRSVKACRPFEERLAQFEASNRLVDTARDDLAAARNTAERERLKAFMEETENARRTLMLTAWDIEQSKSRAK